MRNSKLTITKFNASCERFIRDWRTADLHVAVRDARIHEENALIGVVHLPISTMLSERSQIDRFFPISGGVGYGKIRISILFKPIRFQAPPPLLGWDYGTLNIHPHVRGNFLPGELYGARLKLRTTLSRRKLESDEEGNWKTKKSGAIRLAVRKRHATPLIVEFRPDTIGYKSTLAFAILWLKDIPDEETQTITLPVWKGDLIRAEKCCLDDYGEKVGTVTLSLRFVRGLSSNHVRLSRQDRNVADVMDVLDATHDNYETGFNIFEDHLDDQSVIYSESEPDSENEGDEGADMDGAQDGDIPGLGFRGPMESWVEYRQQWRQLHRKNRGVMQYKVSCQTRVTWRLEIR